MEKNVRVVEVFPSSQKWLCIKLRFKSKSPPRAGFLMGKFLHLAFGQESINENLDHVFVFRRKLFYCFELVKQFFIGKLRRSHLVRSSVHEEIIGRV